MSVCAKNRAFNFGRSAAIVAQDYLGSNHAGVKLESLLASQLGSHASKPARYFVEIDLIECGAN